MKLFYLVLFEFYNYEVQLLCLNLENFIGAVTSMFFIPVECLAQYWPNLVI